MKFYIDDQDVTCEGKWPTTKRSALNESIKKWKVIVAHLEKNRSYLEIPIATIDSCALCHIYYDKDAIDSWQTSECKGCPVSEKTGEGECINTPYHTYVNADDFGKALRAARSEVRFLESLK